jgi:hypothetical protein
LSEDVLGHSAIFPCQIRRDGLREDVLFRFLGTSEQSDETEATNGWWGSNH